MEDKDKRRLENLDAQVKFLNAYETVRQRTKWLIEMEHLGNIRYNVREPHDDLFEVQATKAVCAATQAAFEEMIEAVLGNIKSALGDTSKKLVSVHNSLVYVDTGLDISREAPNFIMVTGFLGRVEGQAAKESEALLCMS